MHSAHLEFQMSNCGRRLHLLHWQWDSSVYTHWLTFKFKLKITLYTSYTSELFFSLQRPQCHPFLLFKNFHPKKLMIYVYCICSAIFKHLHFYCVPGIWKRLKISNWGALNCLAFWFNPPTANEYSIEEKKKKNSISNIDK